MKKVLQKIGNSFRKLGAKIGAWSLTAKIVVPVSLVAVISVGIVSGVMIHQQLEKKRADVAVVDTQTETMSETETEVEPTVCEVEKMVVGIDVPTKNTCWVATSSLEKDLNLYILDKDGNAVKGQTSQVKLISPEQLNGLTEDISKIKTVNALISSAQELENSNQSTDALEEEIRTNQSAELEFDSTQVNTSIHFVKENTTVKTAADSATTSDNTEDTQITENTQITEDTPTEAATEAQYEDLTETQLEEYEQAYQETFATLSLGERLTLYRDSLVKNYADKLNGMEGTVYTDEDADGVIYIPEIAPGDYYACIIPTDEVNPLEYASLANVKDKIEYTVVEHVEAEEVAETNQEDEKNAELIAEFTDTVEYIPSNSEKILPEYATTDQFQLAPVNASTMNTVSGSKYEKNPETSTTSDDVQQITADVDLTTYTKTDTANVLSITNDTTMYPVDVDTAKSTTIKYAVNSAFFQEGTLRVASSQANVTATLNGNGTISVTTTGAPKVAVITLSADYKPYSDLEDVETLSVSCEVKVYPSSQKILDKTGHTLYTDNTHYSTNRTAVTVGNFNSGKKYYYETKAEYTKYYGWQNLNGKRFYFDKNATVVKGKQVINGAKYTFGQDGALLTSGTGIDVSRWQGDINWNKVSGQVSFAIIKCGGREGGLYRDGKFLQNIQGAMNNNMIIGLYFYADTDNVKDAVKDASYVVSLLQQSGVSTSLPIYYDFESTRMRDNYTAEQNTAICKAFCETLESAGYRAGVYTYVWFAEHCLNMSELEQYSIWVAERNTVCSYKGRYDIWQYSWTGKLDGIYGDVDMNTSYFD